VRRRSPEPRSVSEAVAEYTAEDDERMSVLRWRQDRFIAMGFGLANSASLAGSDADPHDAERLLARGCPVDLAAEILL